MLRHIMRSMRQRFSCLTISRESVEESLARFCAESRDCGDIVHRQSLRQSYADVADIRLTLSAKTSALSQKNFPVNCAKTHRCHSGNTCWLNVLCNMAECSSYKIECRSPERDVWEYVNIQVSACEGAYLRRVCAGLGARRGSWSSR